MRYNRVATRDVTSVLKSLPRGKQYGLPMERERCVSGKALISITMIAGGRTEGTTKDLKVYCK